MAASMPAKLAQTVDAFPTELREKLQELYGRVAFGEHHLDSFDANHGVMNLDNFPTFIQEMDKEVAVAAASAKAAKARRDSQGAAKRARMSFLPQAVLGLTGFGRGGATAGSGASPAATTPNKRTREDKGTPEPVRKPVNVSLKASMNSNMDAKPAISTEVAAVSVKLLGDQELWGGPRRGTYAWMDESLEDRTAERDQRLADFEGPLAEAMQQRHEGEETLVGTIGVPSQAETILCGRIVCEGLEGRLNERSMILEGSRATARGARVQLNAAACPNVAAFPGQLVSVLGRSGLSGTTFHARDFVAGIPAPPPAQGCEQVHMLVLAGPFCLKNGLDYSPLEQALEHAARVKPQVVLLVGPFVDATNKLVAEGDVELPGQGEPCSLEEFYSEHVLSLLVRGLQDLRKSIGSTRVLVVPSLDEALAFHPMPQPPLDLELAPNLNDAGVAKLEKLKQMGVQFLPNPAHLDINGLRVSVSSADALSPVLRSGLVLRPEERKIEQALRLLQQQRSLFPVLPREPACVSEARAAALDFPEKVVPDVMIFPSVSGTSQGMLVDARLFVNPGSVCRPAAIGTFAEIWAGAPPTEGAKASVRDRVRVDIQSLA